MRHGLDANNLTQNVPDISETITAAKSLVRHDEVSLYITQKHAMADDRDLLGWWKINSNVYPKQSKLAKSVLCIPASSSSSERVFSAAGRTISERRTAFKPSTVDAILFLHDAM
uniref:HAT C-terminal dimerisation domain-containing protein n=1 Tax=Knipowitschia caucasica TaxID=637954 RepID=A0AAV2J5N9_KNICA